MPRWTLANLGYKKSTVRTFFLNACGSYNEGIEFIEKGSAVGAVTLRNVLNEPAATVGTTFAKLALSGFGFQRALDLARRRIMMNKLYAVVGDGTHRVGNGEDTFPILLKVRPLEERSKFELECQMYSSEHIGSCYQPTLEGSGMFVLLGNERTVRVSHEELLPYLDRANSPVEYQGSLFWSDELCQKLQKQSDTPSSD